MSRCISIHPDLNAQQVATLARIAAGEKYEGRHDAQEGHGS